ncbi:MarR family winged helix-turn-helix transcriptional regulator [Actinoplanes sp. NPDC023714]|uniref:MarR family winged helix-turn-helix transcriptional regulator n=1 Tax=Actinoplanes sp. NPDC023714 TaxID=3154322 RepID=UPI0033E03FF8
MTEPAHLPLREIERRVGALPGVRPRRIVPLLLPVWAVEVTATVRESQSYDVLDRYLSRAVAEGRLDRTEELAEFLGVEQPMVARVVRHLAGIGHLVRDGDKLSLTDLGRRSVADGRRYQLAAGRRMLLRFDGFTGGPVPYATAIHTVWLTQPALRLTDGTTFHEITEISEISDDAVERLLERPDADDFTGPVVPVSATINSVKKQYLPIYLVECDSEDDLVFGRAMDGPDPYLSGFIPFLSGNRET